MNKYQKRYLKHQENKKKTLVKIMKSRYSERCFNSKKVGKKIIKEILKMAEMTPSSCNRKAIEIKLVDDRNDKEFLGGILVGGVGWVHRAGVIFMLIADWSAYKEGLLYMPFLDAGVIVQQVYLACEVLGLGCCYINPNIRKENINYFKDKFNLKDNQIFCGALAIGYKEDL